VFEYVPLGLGLLCVAVVLSGFVATVVRPNYRFWPAGADDRKRRVYLLCSRGSLLALLVAAVLDTGSLAVPPWGRLVGGVATVVALAVLGRAASDLGQAETEGRVGELRTDGLYRYSRNPQNVGYLLGFWAVTVAGASVVAAALAAALTVWLVSQSFVEEPWLREQYEGYDAYAESVPRFVGLRSVRRAVRDLRSPRDDGES
jgi:protein-S-isoprenylcysteine O-methyltransferase Ste14